MKAGLISLLALCQFMALILPSCAGGEMLTIGKYDISFYLNSSDPYSIDAGEEDGSCQAIINDSRHKAVIYIEEAECIGFKDALAIVDQLLAEAEIDQPDHYQMFIDATGPFWGWAASPRRRWRAALHCRLSHVLRSWGHRHICSGGLKLLLGQHHVDARQPECRIEPLCGVRGADHASIALQDAVSLRQSCPRGGTGAGTERL